MELVWGVIAAFVVLVIVIVIIVHFCTAGSKSRSRARVGATGIETLPHTANNSAVPQESEVDPLDDVKRATVKDTERMPMQETQVDV